MNVPTQIHDLRPSLAKFATEMEDKLRKNDHKRDWRELPIAGLRRKLEIELEELKCALDYEGIDEAIDECRDVANFALILWDRLHAEKESQQNIGGTNGFNPKCEPHV